MKLRHNSVAGRRPLAGLRSKAAAFGTAVLLSTAALGCNNVGNQAEYRTNERAVMMAECGCEVTKSPKGYELLKEVRQGIGENMERLRNELKADAHEDVVVRTSLKLNGTGRPEVMSASATCGERECENQHKILQLIGRELKTTTEPVSGQGCRWDIDTVVPRDISRS